MFLGDEYQKQADDNHNLSTWSSGKSFIGPIYTEALFLKTSIKKILRSFFSQLEIQVWVLGGSQHV